VVLAHPGTSIFLLRTCTKNTTRLERLCTTSNLSQLIPDPGTVVIFRQIQEISWYLPRIRVVPETIKSCYGLLVVVFQKYLFPGEIYIALPQSRSRTILKLTVPKVDSLGSKVDSLGLRYK
jgi:hypothetical protein